MLRTLRPIVKRIEYYLSNYPALKEEIAKAKEDIFSLKGYWPDKPPGKNLSNPTERAVTLYESRYGKTEKWLECIDRALSMVEEEDPAKRKLAELRYFNGKRIEEIAGELHIDLTTCWRWRDEFLTLVALLAVEERLISIERRQET
jgi:hypothetical protein